MRAKGRFYLKTGLKVPVVHVGVGINTGALASLLLDLSGLCRSFFDARGRLGLVVDGDHFG